jgi:MoaA/NifB/PqqE/SkfB family radical SAM enzyme
MHNPLRHLFARKPVHLTLFVTRRCNARCPFCFYEAGEASPDELSQGEIERVARSMGDLLWVLFSGGEPFLRSDLAGIAAAFHRAVFLTFPTNGFLPNAIEETMPQVLQRCSESVVVVKLSLDGVGGAHDELRQVPGGFEKVMRSYAVLEKLARRFPNLEIGVNTLFCAANQDSIDGVVRFVRKLDAVRTHTITLVRGQRADLERYRAAVESVESHHRFRGGAFKRVVDSVQKQLIHDTVKEQRRLLPCEAGKLSLVLSERGDLHACEERPDLSFGNVRNFGCDVPRMLTTPRAAAVRAEIARAACFCSHECNTLTNVLYNPAVLLRRSA